MLEIERAQWESHDSAKRVTPQDWGEGTRKLRGGAAFGRDWKAGSARQEQEGRGESSRQSVEWGCCGGIRRGGRWMGLEVW